MLTLPIDEMLSDLREKLELFEREPSYAVLDVVYRETNRICSACEDAFEDMPNELSSPAAEGSPSGARG